MFGKSINYNSNASSIAYLITIIFWGHSFWGKDLKRDETSSEALYLARGPLLFYPYHIDWWITLI